MKVYIMHYVDENYNSVIHEVKTNPEDILLAVKDFYSDSELDDVIATNHDEMIEVIQKNEFALNNYWINEENMEIEAAEI